ncbi:MULTISPECIES: hypothetical protein [unclassified Wolbachia]|uniref:hypothetical protein n=1 Tax=unclassified Wolbachia TaxID=2640676 RepID=UPI0021F8B574|nr:MULTISPECIES: hypothetical protein [unclassified Wolbachia]
MTIDNSVQNSTQNLAGINSEGSKPIMSKIDPIKFTASGTPYTADQLKRPAPFSHVQNIIGKVTDNMNNMIDILNTTLKAEQTKVITLIGTVGDENSGLIKTINDLKSELEPPPMDAPEFI